MKKLLKYLHGYRAISILGPVFKLLESLVELFIPLIVAAIIDNGIKKGNTEYVIQMSALMLILYLIGFIFSVICQYFAAVSAFGFGYNLRKKLYSHINALPLSSVDKIKTSSLITRLNMDVSSVQNALNRFIRLVTRAPFILVGALIMAVRISPSLSLIFFGAAFLLGIALTIVSLRSAPRYKKVSYSQDEITLLARENLSGSRVVRAFNKQDEEEEVFSVRTGELKKSSVLASAVSVLSGPLTYLIVNGAMLLVALLGARTVNIGKNTQGQLVALVNYLLLILNGMLILAMIFTLFSKAGAAVVRINKVLDLPPQEKTAGLTEFDLGYSPAIDCSGVSFCYGTDAPAIKNVSFTLKNGETLGIIGGTGSGKSTLAGLFCGLYDYSGSIKLFGAELNEYDKDFLIAAVSLAPQKAVLFSGTIKSNLLMAAPQATDEEIYAALRIAQADFVTDLDATVTRGGSNFSGGQRQRLALARTILKNPQILILDDAASALDYSTESDLRRELKKLDATKIIISQRIVSVKNAGLILVMDDGVCVGAGTHKELLKTCEIYRRTNEIQGGVL